MSKFSLHWPYVSFICSPLELFRTGVRFFPVLVCARKPLFVIIPGVVAIIALSAGTVMLEITTDPVELWASAGSRSRVEKDYYDSTFVPFYRTEQLIITARNIEPIMHNTGMEVESFGPIFDLDFMKEVLDLQTYIAHNVSGIDPDTDEPVFLNDICFKPLDPANTNCAIFSYLSWWQNDYNNILKNATRNDGGVDNYLDHFKYCSVNTASPNDTTALKMSCQGEYGGPIDPVVVLGGFLNSCKFSFLS